MFEKASNALAFFIFEKDHLSFVPYQLKLISRFQIFLPQVRHYI